MLSLVSGAARDLRRRWEEKRDSLWGLSSLCVFIFFPFSFSFFFAPGTVAEDPISLRFLEGEEEEPLRRRRGEMALEESGRAFGPELGLDPEFDPEPLPLPFPASLD